MEWDLGVEIVRAEGSFEVWGTIKPHSYYSLTKTDNELRQKS